MSDPTPSDPVPVPGADATASPAAPTEAEPSVGGGGSQRGTFWTVLVIVAMFLVNIWVYSPLSNKGRTRPSPGYPAAAPRPPEGGRESGATPRPPGDGPRSPGDGPRSPGDGPRSPGDGPRSPGDGPRSPGDRPRSPLDGASEGNPPPPPPSGERQGGSGLSFRLVLGVAMLDQGEASLRLDATQKEALRSELRAALPRLDAAYRAQGELQDVLTNAQIEYLNTHRGSFTYQGKTYERPEPAAVASLLEERVKEAASSSSDATPSPSAERVRFALDLDDLLGAPVRLEGDAAVRLSASQAQRFRAVVLQVKEAGEVEARLSAAIDRTLRPEQMKYLQSHGAEMEALRHTLVLTLLTSTLAGPEEK